jgi:3-dehydroquinate dehydratase-2
MKILVLHGPNLNLFGRREPHIYGTTTLAQKSTTCLASTGQRTGRELETIQSNHEGALIDFLHEHIDTAQGALVNPAGLTQHGVPLHDAIKAMPFPVLEVHMSNIAAREAWRSHSIISPAVKGTIQGLGPRSYLQGLRVVTDIAREAASPCQAAKLIMDKLRRQGLQRHRVPHRPRPGHHGRAGVRQRRAALRLQLGHHGVRRGVALAVHLGHLPRRARRAAEHGHLGIDMVVGRLPVIGKKICLIIGHVLMIFIVVLLAMGSWEQVKINWDVTAPTTGCVDGHRLCSRVSCSACWRAACMLLDLWKVITGQLSEDELVMVQESEAAVQLTSRCWTTARQPDNTVGAAAMTIFIFIGSLLAAMALGIPIAFALLASGVALMWHLQHVRRADPRAEPDRRRRQLPAAGRALLHAGRRDHERRRPVAPHRRPGAGAGRPHQGRAGLRDDHGGLPAVGAVGLGRGRRRRAHRAAAADDGQGRARQGSAPAA